MANNQSKPNKQFWFHLANMYPEISQEDAVASLLRDNNIVFTIPSKGCYKINSNPSKCNGVMFYPRTGKVVVQTSSSNAGISSTYDLPLLVVSAIQEYV